MGAAGQAGQAIATRLGTPDEAWLRGLLEELEAIHRPSASPGERQAAQWLVARFAELGADARIEVERAHGTYWWPLGIGAAIADEFPPNRRRLRSLLPQRETYNVVCELGDADAERTVVLVAHHDSAHSGLVFHPALPQIADRVGLIERTDTSPMLMAPVIGGPAAAALAGVTGSRALARLAMLLGTGSTLAMADIGARDVAPGAND